MNPIGHSSRGITVVLALVLVSAGCLSGAPVPGQSATATPAERSTTPGPTGTTQLTSWTSTTPGAGGPTPTADGRVTLRPYPDRPESLTNETVRQFVRAYERAYKWNRERTNDTIELTINPVRSTVRNATGSGYVVHLEVGLSHTLESDGDTMVGDGFYTANYFVNESTVMRAATGGEARPGPDPRNGTVVDE